MVHKVEGQLICEDVCVDRLTEIRTVLEKIRPLDQRLSYQVDKLIKTSNTGLSGKCLLLTRNDTTVITLLTLFDQDTCKYL